MILYKKMVSNGFNQGVIFQLLTLIKKTRTGLGP